jgi:DNA-binding MarR family transcriptional regulator
MKILKFVNASPAFAIVTASRTIQNSIAAKNNAEPLSYLQAMILAALFFENDQRSSPKSLAESFSTTKSNISHALSSLEGIKLIRRQTNKADARKYDIVLTEKGSKRAILLVKVFDTFQRKTEDRFSESGTLRLVSDINEIKRLHKM